MSRRRIVIFLLAIWGVFATLSFSNCRRSVPPNQEPIDQPSLLSSDPSEATQAYWLFGRQVSKRCARSVFTLEELRQRGETIKSLADGQRVWSQLAVEYSHMAEVYSEGTKELELLSTENIDPLAVECVTELVGYMILERDLMRKTHIDCSTMASLFGKIQAEGEEFDWNSPNGKEYGRQEDELTDKMKRTVANEGAASKQRLAELTIKVKKAAGILSNKHKRQFPDLLGH